MEIKTRRNFFGKIAGMAALVAGAPKLCPTHGGITSVTREVEKIR